jgi:predicted nucleotidyltransferase
VQALEFADEGKRNQWIDSKGMQVFSMYDPVQPAVTIDLFVRYPIPYEELCSRSVMMDLGELKVRVCSIDDLITMKQDAGRYKDLADIEQLTKIKHYEKD